MFCWSRKDEDADDSKKDKLIAEHGSTDKANQVFPIYFSLNRSESKRGEKYENTFALTRAKPEALEFPQETWNEIVDDLKYVINSEIEGRRMCLSFSTSVVILLGLAAWIGVDYSWEKEEYIIAGCFMAAILLLLFRMYAFFGSVLDKDLAQTITAIDKYGASNSVLQDYRFSYAVERPWICSRPNRYLKIERVGKQNTIVAVPSPPDVENLMIKSAEECGTIDLETRHQILGAATC